jgi:TRAP-type C4-dicarboxylate transport system substrate-binding protein
MRMVLHFIIAGVMIAMPLTGQAFAKTIELKMAHQWPQDPDDYVVATGIQFADEVAKLTNGQVKIKIYPAESLVKAKDIHTALQNGTVDMAIYPYIYAAGAIPELNIILLPGLWKTHDDVYAFRKSEVWKTLEQKANNFGFKTLCWIQIAGGVASKGKPIHLPSDVKGLKVRAAGKYMEIPLKAIGASPVSMPSSEVYIAMQQRLLEALWTSSSSFGSYRIYEVADYYTSPEDYTIFYTIEPITISMKTWNKLTPEQQKVLLKVGESLEPKALAGAKHEDVRVAKLFADKGVKVEKMDEKDWTEWFGTFKQYSFPKFIEAVPDGKSLLDSALKYYKR